MQTELERIQEARNEANQILAECYVKRWPLGLAHMTIQILLREKGIVVPDDVLAWVSYGYTSDTVVKNWASPEGS